ncbi:kinase-like domain-containing protein [Fennellomyces sp. T-0311]|nr:kinase-like domain-containing protein [Fennellomyces sp. T-0311]
MTCLYTPHSSPSPLLTCRSDCDSQRWQQQQSKRRHIWPTHSPRWALAIKGIFLRSREPVHPPEKEEHDYKQEAKQSCDLDNGYTDILKSIGVGSYADVRLVKSKNSSQMLAIKTFRKRPKKVSERNYMKQINAEFCIASSLDHPNIVKTFDLGTDSMGRYFTTMEYCTDGDLCTAITNGSLRSLDELHCYFKQLLQGMAYLHDVIGIAHRDIKPENLLLHGHLLKITDFGVADVMREAWQTKKRRSYKLCGTRSYVAPEIFIQPDYRGDKADMWSVGIVYYVMRRGEMLFASAKICDTFYRTYLRYQHDRQYTLFNKLNPPEARDMLYRLLDPNPSRRYSAQQLLQLPWIAQIQACCQTSKYHDHANQHASLNRRQLSSYVESVNKLAYKCM